MNITKSLQNAMDSVGNFLPKALAFVAILIIGWIIAKVLRKVVTKLLAKVGLDRAAERGGLRRFTGNYTMSELSGTLVYAMILLFTLQIGFSAFGPNPVSDVINSLVSWLPQLFIAGVIMVVAFAIANMAFELVSGTMSSMSYGRTLARIAQVAIIAIAAIAALNQIGIATTVTTPILVAALAMVAGTVIVGVGGGLIQPMRARWERMLGAVETEATSLKAQRSNSRPAAEFGQPSYSSQQYTDTGVDSQQRTEQPQYQEAPGHTYQSEAAARPPGDGQFTTASSGGYPQSTTEHSSESTREFPQQFPEGGRSTTG
jgi:hypothetical protein